MQNHVPYNKNLRCTKVSESYVILFACVRFAGKAKIKLSD